MRRMIFVCLTLIAFAAPANAEGLIARVSGLEESNAALQADNASLRADVDALKTAVAALTERLDAQWSMTFHRCDGDGDGQGDRYACTPRMCKELCEARGERIPTVDEVAAWSMFNRRNLCNYIWMADLGAGGVRRGYPMYNYSGSSCINANNATMLSTEGAQSWDRAPHKANCLCTNKPF